MNLDNLARGINSVCEFGGFNLRWSINLTNSRVEFRQQNLKIRGSLANSAENVGRDVVARRYGDEFWVELNSAGRVQEQANLRQIQTKKCARPRKLG